MKSGADFGNGGIIRKGNEAVFGKKCGKPVTSLAEFAERNVMIIRYNGIFGNVRVFIFLFGKKIWETGNNNA